MQAKIAIVIASVCCAMNGADAIFGTLSAAAAGTGVAATFTGLGAAAGTTAFLTPAGAIIGAKIVGLAALGAIELARAGSRSRGKRAAQHLLSEEEIDAQIAAFAGQEPEHCYRRFICELASGYVQAPTANTMLALFENEVPVESPRFDFRTAAIVGQVAAQKDSPLMCQRRFRCVFTGQQIGDMLA